MSDRTEWLAKIGDLPVDAETFFPDTDGLLVRRANAAKAKLLAKNADTLRRALKPGERIRYAAHGIRYWFWETYFAGWASYHHNQHLIVLTDRRLLLVQITSRGNTADLKNQIRLEELCGTKQPSFFSLNVFAIVCADGRKLGFSRIPKRDRAALTALLPKAATPGRAPQVGSVEHLCPACLTVIPGPVGTTLTCPEPTCRIPFRDPRKAARLSGWIPGLGDLYLRHHLFGATEFLGSTVMLGFALVLLLTAALGGKPAQWIAAALVVPILVGVPRFIDYRLTLHMARKGLVPLALAPAPGAAARNLPSFPRWAPLLFAAGVAIVVGAPALMSGALVEDARYDREVVDVAAAGRFDEALAAYDAAKARGFVTEARRVHLLDALYAAGDLAGADRIRGELHGSPIDEDLAKRVNAAAEAEQLALTAYQEGVRAFFQGDEAAAWAKLDPALAFFRHVKRPHLPATRGEVRMHAAASMLAPPVDAEAVAFATRMLADAGDAPPAEVAVVRAALDSAEGNRARVTAALHDAPADLDVAFRLLALEARARVAADDTERKAVAEGAKAIPAAALDDDDAERVAELVGDTHL